MIQNIAVDDEGYFVGWKTDNKEYNFAVHLLLEPHLNIPSRCFFFETMAEANMAKDHISAAFNNELQRVEICKVQYDLTRSQY
tara:strand:- start:623 stop:871 length:249 start_codon:yes stop_codon:yes gene_type:complete